MLHVQRLRKSWEAENRTKMGLHVNKRPSLPVSPQQRGICQNCVIGCWKSGPTQAHHDSAAHECAARMARRKHAAAQRQSDNLHSAGGRRTCTRLERGSVPRASARPDAGLGVQLKPAGRDRRSKTALGHVRLKAKPAPRVVSLSRTCAHGLGRNVGPRAHCWTARTEARLSRCPLPGTQGAQQAPSRPSAGAQRPPQNWAPAPAPARKARRARPPRGGMKESTQRMRAAGRPRPPLHILPLARGAAPLAHALRLAGRHLRAARAASRTPPTARGCALLASSTAPGGEPARAAMQRRRCRAQAQRCKRTRSGGARASQ